ncbi:MAG: exodeoxyribonuclease VII large subunit [Candidatus Zixiibacteriota bacterium]|nr:MAG: exodeoxyribonuclease VII large subunit [candidate division Zixibacteria bacterium]
MSNNVLSVTELTKSIKLLLEDNFPRLWVEGEISNYIQHTSGHKYFTLKDENAQIRCVMWKGMGRYLSFEPENGMKVKACGQVTVYEKSGQYQLVVSTMQPAGVGELEIAFQQLKMKLEKEGLFDESRKKPIPEYPEKIGVITSPTGAAIRDIIDIISRRAPWVEIVIRPTLVQGEGASSDIVEAINEFNSFKEVDLLIVGRGGGSIEDLWPFNEESTARAIFSSELPVISAVGHQVDFTIADFVADLRAPTPSAAAEMAVPDGSELKGHFVERYRRLCQIQFDNIQSGKDRLKGLTARYGLRKPMEIITTRTQRLDELTQSFHKTASYMIEKFKSRLSVLTSRLESASPVNIMNRGYAYVSSPVTGVNIKSYVEVAIGDEVDVRLYKGGFTAGVTKIRGDN